MCSWLIHLRSRRLSEQRATGPNANHSGKRRSCFQTARCSWWSFRTLQRDDGLEWTRCKCLARSNFNDHDGHGHGCFDGAISPSAHSSAGSTFLSSLLDLDSSRHATGLDSTHLYDIAIGILTTLFFYLDLSTIHYDISFGFTFAFVSMGSPIYHDHSTDSFLLTDSLTTWIDVVSPVVVVGVV